MTNQEKLLQTSKLIDLIDVALCFKLYDVCNDNLIESTTRSNFICWLNLKPTDPPICLLPREKTRFSYFVNVVAEHLIIKQFKPHWIDAMLKSCNVPRAHYDKHNYEVPCDLHVKKNQDLVEGIEHAIQEAKKFMSTN